MTPTTPEEGAVLAPCPFCSGVNITDRHVRDGRQMFCIGCGASVAPTYHGPNNDTLERAREAWNRRAPIATPMHQERGAGNASYNIEAIAKVISLSYGENPDDDAPPTKICGPNNEPLPNWQAYEEQAKAVFVWFDAVLSALQHQERGEVVKLEPRLAQMLERWETERYKGVMLPATLLTCDKLAAAIRSALVPSSLLREAQEALQKTRDALVDAEEELRLIRMKDCGAVYDTLLRSLTIPLALQSADTVLARLGGAS